MKHVTIFTLLICGLFAGCATLAERSRMIKFSEIADAYEHALRMADYNTASKYMDPSAADSRPDSDVLKNIKIVEYQVTRVDVSESKKKITQDVQLRYFRLNSNILRTAHDSQIWRYREKGDVWLLQTGLPDLQP